MKGEEGVLPCPFCGGTAVAKRNTVGLLVTRMCCTKCGAFGPPAIKDTSDPVARWNRRVDVKRKRKKKR